jgi:ATP-dependent DNA helicase RecQ
MFGVRSLKAEQRQCIECAKSGVGVLAILPTGFGKSLCYQIPCVQKQGTAVAVTPLIALALDQVQHVRAHGIKAVRFDSSVSLADRASIAIDLQNPDTSVKAVFITLSHCQLLVESLKKET